MPPELNLSWSFKPIFSLGLLLLAGLYIWSLRMGRLSPWQIAWRPLLFFTGLGLSLLLVCSPLDALGYQALFIVRMLETIVITYILPCFLLLGLPAGLLERLWNWPPGRRGLHFLSGTVSNSVIFSLLFMLWHAPVFYVLSWRSQLFNEVQWLILLLAGMLMWLPVLSPFLPLRLSLTRQMFYLVTLIFGQIPVFALLTFSSQALYAPYLSAPRLTGLSAYADQQLGGWALKVISSLIFAGAFIVIFLNWDRQQRLRDKQENALVFENFKLAQQAERREG